MDMPELTISLPQLKSAELLELIIASPLPGLGDGPQYSELATWLHENWRQQSSLANAGLWLLAGNLDESHQISQSIESPKAVSGMASCIGVKAIFGMRNTGSAASADIRCYLNWKNTITEPRYFRGPLRSGRWKTSGCAGVTSGSVARMAIAIRLLFGLDRFGLRQWGHWTAKS